MTLEQPEEQANVHSVSVVLPKELTARGSTVVGACLEQTFQADPAGCAAAQVGTVSSSTPLLAGTLDGPVYLVAHPGGGLPTLEAVLTGPGLLIRLTGSITFAAAGLTSTFASVPDLPITRFVLTLPTGPHSALSSTKGVCGGPLTMATTITGQNGAQIAKTTPIDVTGCAASKPTGGLKLRILRARVRGSLVALTVKVPRAGRLVATGKGLRKASVKVARARTLTMKVSLSKAGVKRRASLHRHHKHLKVHVRLHLGTLVASRFVTFR